MSAQLLAGATRRDITPTWPAKLAGHEMRRGLAEGVATPLYLRVLALSDGETSILIGVIDALWWPPEASDDIRARVAAELGLEPHFVVLHATHTHSSCQLSTAFAPTLGEFDPQFLELAVTSLIQGGRQALDELRPCTAHAGMTHTRIGTYRRSLRDGSIVMQPDISVPIDDRLRVVQLRAGNEVIATVVHYACHPTTTSEMRISADFPGILTSQLDESEGGTSLMLQGCAGDVRVATLNPEQDTFIPGDADDVIGFGTQLAEATRDALQQATELTPSRLEAALSQVPVTLASGTDKPLRIIRLRLAEQWLWIGMACEPVGRYQQVAPAAWISGYTNGMIGYLTTAQQLREGGYEPLASLPHFGLDSPFAEETEALVVDALTDLTSG